LQLLLSWGDLGLKEVAVVVVELEHGGVVEHGYFSEPFGPYILPWCAGYTFEEELS
jgi:hypothetical protein